MAIFQHGENYYIDFRFKGPESPGVHRPIQERRSETGFW